LRHAICVLFFTGAAGDIVTAAYLVIHHDESLSPRRSAYAWARTWPGFDHLDRG
jgi:hypothetical protein